MMTLTDVRVTVGDRDLLVGANLRVEPGETVGLVGANGCGKSTLLRCVSGLRSHDAGELRVAQRADVGYLEQTAVSGSKLTVAEEARSRMTHVKAAQDAVRAAEAKGEIIDSVAAAVILDDFFAAEEAACNAAPYVPSSVVVPPPSEVSNSVAPNINAS